MTSLILMRSMLIGQVVVAPTRLVVIGDRAIADDLRAKIDVSPITVAIARLVSQKYERVDQESVVFLFSPSVWGGDRLSERLGVWKDLLKAAQADGTVDLRSASQLSRFLDDRLSMLGYEGAAQSNLLVNASSTVTITVDGVSRQIRYGGSPGRRSKDLRERPLRAIDPKSKTNRNDLGDFGQFVPPDSLSAYSPGPRAFDAVQRMQDVSKAGALLSDRYQKARADLATVQSNLASRFPQLAPLAIDKGASVDRLPGNLRFQIESSLIRDFKAAGFSDQNEAEIWVSRARVTASSTSYRIMASGPPGSGLFGVELP